MSNLGRLVRQTLTIARRDFIATVFTPAFLVFLLAPLLMMTFGSLGGMGAANMASVGTDKVRIVAITSADDTARLSTADMRLRRAFRTEDDGPPDLRVDAAQADPAVQAHRLFNGGDVDVVAVLYGPVERPTILYSNSAARSADYLALLAEDAARARRTGDVPLSRATREKISRPVAVRPSHGELGFIAVFGLFLMTLLTASQVIGTMAEERNNKVIEVLAAAVPLESVFLGKLLGMFGVALLFVGFWGTVAVNVAHLLPSGLGDATPAVGGPMFGLLFFLYFSMSYLLLGSAFLIVGAQASTPREIQMMSLPLTIMQMAMLGLSIAAASHPDSLLALGAEIFPLSSPFAMAARAANKADLWPHLLALLWQLLWVALLITFGARWFRRGVLQSGGGRSRRRAQPASA
jgi:ABC-2 type transport system permease protein